MTAYVRYRESEVFRILCRSGGPGEYWVEQVARREYCILLLRMLRGAIDEA